MKLHELAVPNNSQKIAQVFESYFESRIDVGVLNQRQARGMLSRIQRLLREHKATFRRHDSERNPAYLKLLMIEQALSTRLAEMQPPVSSSTNTTQPNAGNNANKPKDPKLEAALKKSASGQSLTPEEQKLVAGAAMQAQESRLRRAYRMLKESEVQQAQVVLAAQDMVDKMQAMLEDASEMQFKELPALVDSIKNQVGIDQAQQFNTDATAALTGLMQNLQGAKQQLDQALGVVTGQAPAAAPGGMPGDIAADTGAASPPAPGGEELDLSLDANLPGEEGDQASLGRSRR